MERNVNGTLVIVPCGQRKIWDRHAEAGPTAARHAYTGAPFRVNREFAEKFGDRWVILSAKYGFISPDFVIPGPYEVTFKKKHTNPIPLSTLAEQVRDQSLGQFQRVIGLGGKDYVLVIRQAFAAWSVRPVFPFAGLALGKMMRATRKAIESGVPCPDEPPNNEMQRTRPAQATEPRR